MAEKKFPKQVKICPRCGGTDIGVYPDESGFHFQCFKCGNLFIYGLSRAQMEKLEKEAGSIKKI